MIVCITEGGESWILDHIPDLPVNKLRGVCGVIGRDVESRWKEKIDCVG